MSEFRVLLSDRAERDLAAVHPKDRERIAVDLGLLEHGSWPGGKVKPLRGHPLFELKCGDFRILFQRDDPRLVVARIVNRKDLDRILRNR